MQDGLHRTFQLSFGSINLSSAKTGNGFTAPLKSGRSVWFHNLSSAKTGDGFSARRNSGRSALLCAFSRIQVRAPTPST